jgi:hypothetical protein
MKAASIMNYFRNIGMFHTTLYLLVSILRELITQQNCNVKNELREVNVSLWQDHIPFGR